jgi:predicted transcriptional regulator
MSDELERFKADAKALANGGEISITPRELLAKFGYERRTRWVMAHVRKILRELQLEEVTNIQEVYLNVEVILRKDTGEIKPPHTDPQLRLKVLPAANQVPLWVSPNTPISKAMTLMILNDFSQLPVLNNPRKVMGMISWKSLGRAFAWNKVPKEVKDCRDSYVIVFDYEDPILDAIDDIMMHEVILIESSASGICGIVTTTDIAELFVDHTEPFMAIEQLEKQLRVVIDKFFTLEEMQSAKFGEDDRVIAGSSDLTFGEYLNILDTDENWGRLKISLDRGPILEKLKSINETRNDVMHFSPDKVGPDKLDEIWAVSDLLDGLINSLEE